jgi:hypothetical protein
MKNIREAIFYFESLLKVDTSSEPLEHMPSPKTSYEVLGATIQKK